MDAISSHVAKATTRAAVNTSPEPFSNIGMSLIGDGAVPVALWLAWTHPEAFFAALALALVVMLALTWMLARFLKQLIRRFGARSHHVQEDPHRQPR